MVSVRRVLQAQLSAVHDVDREPERVTALGSHEPHVSVRETVEPDVHAAVPLRLCPERAVPLVVGVATGSGDVFHGDTDATGVGRVVGDRPSRCRAHRVEGRPARGTEADGETHALRPPLKVFANALTVGRFVGDGAGAGAGDGEGAGAGARRWEVPAACDGEGAGQVTARVPVTGSEPDLGAGPTCGRVEVRVVSHLGIRGHGLGAAVGHPGVGLVLVEVDERLAATARPDRRRARR